MDPEERIEKAVEVAVAYGGIEGDHHKAWVIDQMLRKLMTEDEYRTMRTEAEEGGYDYDEGIAP